ncbi:glycoside hydrolase family 32 protein [Martelella mediterranea]|uniref:beta-fructofuranosidase n=1 Tax=Martelella mediterranea TaxID=293089 RepID=A0A4R3NHU0_9HYPH|nr:glycoside hydrolase family 32 protein [Martelella mediterranea]TCT33060.1 beta-fructofuranosidase [Martelella mediterranea]
MSIFYRPEEAWVGDAIPVFDGTYKIYFLADRRAGGTYGENTSWDMVETVDMVRFTEHGTALPHGTATAPDRNAYTGSVLTDRDGKRHIFYTGHNPDITEDELPLQVVLHASSDDGITWEKTSGFALYSKNDRYERHDWRDPFVFWSDEKACYIMLVTARLKGASAHTGGCIAALHSHDLVHWEEVEPFFAPDQYITLECPDYFRMGDWHYLVYSTFSERFVTHWRKARSLDGPWLSVPGDTFDARGCYALKTAGEDSGRRFAFGWVPTKKGETDYGPWEWAGTLIAHDIWQDRNGDLFSRLPEALVGSFSDPAPLDVPFNDDGWRIGRVDGQDRLTLADTPEKCLVETNFSDWNDAQSFGIALRCDPDFDKGYFIRFEPAFNRMTFDMWPRQEPGEFQWQIAGDRPQMVELERWIDFPATARLNLKIVIDGDILMANVNDRVTMTTRIYNHRDGKIAAFCNGGGVTVHSPSVKTAP